MTTGTSWPSTFHTPQAHFAASTTAFNQHLAMTGESQATLEVLLQGFPGTDGLYQFPALLHKDLQSSVKSTPRLLVQH